MFAKGSSFITWACAQAWYSHYPPWSSLINEFPGTGAAAVSYLLLSCFRWWPEGTKRQAGEILGDLAPELASNLAESHIFDWTGRLQCIDVARPSRFNCSLSAGCESVQALNANFVVAARTFAVAISAIKAVGASAHPFLSFPTMSQRPRAMLYYAMPGMKAYRPAYNEPPWPKMSLLRPKMWTQGTGSKLDVKPVSVLKTKIWFAAQSFAVCIDNLD